MRALAWRLALLLPLGFGLSCISVSPIDEDIDGFGIASEMAHELAYAVCTQREACCITPELWFDFGLNYNGALDCTTKIVSALEAGVEGWQDVARRDYGMVRDGEVVFRFPTEAKR